MKQLLRLFILLVIIFSLVTCEQQAAKDDEDGVNESAFVLSKISAPPPGKDPCPASFKMVRHS